MIYETGQLEGVSNHPLLREALQRWRQGDTVEACDEAFDALKQPPDDTPLQSFDWVLLSNLAEACGRFSRSRATLRIGHRKTPGGLHSLLHAWDLAAYGKFYECQEILDSEREDASNPYHTLLDAIDAYSYSVIEWHETARKHHEATANRAGDDPNVWYILSRASARRTDWQQAVEEGRRALELAPAWIRAKSALSDSLIATGDLETAQELVKVEPGEIPDARIDFARAMVQEAAHDIPAAIEQLEQLVDRWPKQSKLRQYGVRQLALLLYQQEQDAKADELLRNNRIKGFDDLSQKEDRRQKYISVPLVSQIKNHCVPTVAAMVAGAQGVEYSPIELAEKMNTRHGTSIWRMVDCMVSLGFQVYCVKPEIEIVERILDQNIPLIGSLQGVFNSHVDVVCGYNARLQLFHVRDPMHWYGRSFSGERLVKRYQDSPSLWVLIAPDRVGKVEIKKEWINEPAIGVTNLSRAASQGDRITAEVSAAQVPDDHPLAFLRDNYGRMVVITQSEYTKRIRKLARFGESEAEEGEEGDEDTRRVLAMLQLIDEDNADEIIAEAKKHEKKLGKNFVQYVEAVGLSVRHQWDDACQAFSALARKWPYLDNVWSQLAGIQQQLGLADEAKESLAHALEIAPDNEQLWGLWLEQNQDDMPYAEQEKWSRQMVDDYSDRPQTRFVLAETLQMDPDGNKYESALFDCARYFPRSVFPYQQLSTWYLHQERSDLAREILAKGRALIGEEELPIMDWERTTKDSSADEHSPEMESPNQPSSSPDTAQREDQGSNSTSARFESLMKKVQEDAFDLPFAELQKHSAMIELKRLDRERKIHWWQSVRLLALQITNLLADPTLGSDGGQAERLRELLPEQVPGIPEKYIDMLLEMVSFHSSERAIVVEVLQWLDRMCKHRERYASLQFNRAFLIELAGNLNESEEALRKITEQHPAYIGAWYRLGQIANSRSDYGTARTHFEKCLQISPGHFGSLVELTALHQMLETGRESEYRIRLSKLFPKSHRYAYEAAWAICNQSGMKEALHFIEERDADFDRKHRNLIKARILVDAGNWKEAQSLLDEGEFPEGHRYAIAWLNVDCAVGQEEWGKCQELLESMRKEWPDDPDIIDQLVRCYRIEDRVKAKRFARQELEKGNSLGILAYVLVQDEPDPVPMAIEIIEKVEKEKQRDEVATVFHEAFLQSDNLTHLISFLKWCNTRLPHLKNLRAEYAIRLHMLNEADEAIRIAQELYDSEPDNPHWLNLLGICWQDKDPQTSVTWLEKEYEITGNAETLGRIARGYQLMDKHEKAKSCYYRALEANPFDTLAMSNLMHVYHDASPRMFDWVVGAIKQGAGSATQYFLVDAIRVAKKNRKRLPAAWYSNAVRRLEMLEIEQPFRDEKERLRGALLASLVFWKRPDLARAYGGPIARWLVPFRWPGTSWISREPAPELASDG